jgi:hypothetical protein
MLTIDEGWSIRNGRNIYKLNNKFRVQQFISGVKWKFVQYHLFWSCLLCLLSFISILFSIFFPSLHFISVYMHAYKRQCVHSDSLMEMKSQDINDYLISFTHLLISFRWNSWINECDVTAALILFMVLLLSSQKSVICENINCISIRMMKVLLYLLKHGGKLDLIVAYGWKCLQIVRGKF